MPLLREYRIFISHAWQYHSDYDRLIRLLNEAPNFRYRNYSVPRHDPLHVRSKEELKEELRQQIRPVQVVLILSGMYVDYSEWIQFEMDYAHQLEKPIIGIKPWGSERIPRPVQEKVVEIVGWNTRSIVDAIRRYA